MKRTINLAHIFDLPLLHHIKRKHLAINSTVEIERLPGKYSGAYQPVKTAICEQISRMVKYTHMREYYTNTIYNHCIQVSQKTTATSPAMKVKISGDGARYSVLFFISRITGHYSLRTRWV